MKWVVSLLLLILVGCSVEKPVEQIENIEKPVQEVGNMKLASNDFNEGEMIPSKFTCQGEDINPQLAWDDVPEGVKSFALIFDDPDAPAGTWVHWLVKDIPAAVREISQNSVPGTQVMNSFGKKDYGGPCPPSGVHRFFFRLYALGVESLDALDKGDFYRQVEEHAIAKVELLGTYTKG